MKRLFTLIVCLVLAVAVLPCNALGAAIYSTGSTWSWVRTLWMTDRSDWSYPDTDDLHILCSFVLSDIEEYGGTELKTIMDEALKNQTLYFGVSPDSTAVFVMMYCFGNSKTICLNGMIFLNDIKSATLYVDVFNSSDNSGFMNGINKYNWVKKMNISDMTYYLDITGYKLPSSLQRTTSSSSSSSSSSTNGKKINVTQGCNIRSGAGTEYDIVGRANSGETYAYLGNVTNKSTGSIWYKITYKGKTAYISSSMADIIN